MHLCLVFSVTRMLNVDKVMLWQYLIVGLDQTVHGSEEELSDLRHTLLYVEHQLTLANTSFVDSLSTTLLKRCCGSEIQISVPGVVYGGSSLATGIGLKCRHSQW